MRNYSEFRNIISRMGHDVQNIAQMSNLGRHPALFKFFLLLIRIQELSQAVRSYELNLQKKLNFRDCKANLSHGFLPPPPMKFISPSDAKKIDDDLLEKGTTIESLIEIAGFLAFDVIAKEIIKKKSNVLIAIGPGNNGSDGLVIARWL